MHNLKAERRRQLKRLAIQIVAQLPDEHRDAAAVLGYCDELLSDFLTEKPADGAAGGNVFSLTDRPQGEISSSDTI